MTTQYSIKIDKKLKDNAMNAASQLGVPLAVLTKAFYQHLIVSKRITFSTTQNEDLDQVIDQVLQSTKVKNSFKKMASYLKDHPVKK